MKQHPNTNVDIFAVLLNNIPILVRSIIYPIINRFVLENGSWGLIRASSNKPSLVVVTESTTSKSGMKNIGVSTPEKM